MQSSNSLPSNDVNGKGSQFEPITFAVFLLSLRNFAKFVEFLVGWLIGGPAGSGGVFREAAEDTIEELNNYQAKVEPILRDVPNTVGFDWPVAVREWNNTIGQVYKFQDELWNKYKGRNLLGATFYGGWTNATIMRHHLGRMLVVQAEIEDLHHRGLQRELDIVKQEIGDVRKPGTIRGDLWELEAKIAKYEALFTPQITHLISALPELYLTTEKIIERVLQLQRGEIGDIDPVTRQMFARLLTVQGEIVRVINGVPLDASNKELFEQIAVLRGASRRLGFWIEAVQAQLQQRTLPQMQRDIKILKEQTALIPPALQIIEALVNQVDDITRRQLPELRQWIQSIIAPINQTLNRLQRQIDFINEERWPLLLAALTAFKELWPGSREDAIREACDCAIAKIPEELDKQLTCKRILQILCECRDSEDPEIKELWKCIGNDRIAEQLKFPVPRQLPLARTVAEPPSRLQQ